MRDCLASIARQTRLPAEAILGVPPARTCRTPGATVVRADVVSTVAQRNAGVRAARSPPVLFVDDDITLDPDWGSYRRDLLQREPFDESFTGYVLTEDADLAARMIKLRRSYTRLGRGAGTRTRRCVPAWANGRVLPGRHRRRGLLGRVAREWANAAELAILLTRALRDRDLAAARAYLRGLRETAPT
ncbi:MAG: hypothetical protein M3304_08195 [Actinomycetota bacterium]|nr:hypothetical protein [Actinomycetota bacterium]